MSDKNIRSVAYLYNEMDPSEKLEFERDLKNDENLLIEVETLRKISTKLQEMDAVQPPGEVIHAILQTLEKRKTKTGNKKAQKFAIYSAAAILMLGLTFGFFLFGDSTNDVSDNSETASIGSIQNVMPASISNSARDTENGQLMPWVDENDVLHFQDGLYGSEASYADSIFRQSYQKLTPITNPTQSVTARQNLHLTGSRR